MATSLVPERAGPLAGIRILDMATVLAAPFAATLCADLGAEVIKLELPDGTDPLRSLAPVKDGLPIYWKVTNRGKKGITLDVRKPQGRELFLRLVAGVDVLVENFRTGTLERWGLDADTLRAANPKLVVLRVTGFGQTGPRAAKPGFARIFEAMSGLTNLTGEADGSPMHMNFPIGDTVAGLFGAFAIAAEMVRIRSDPQAMGVQIDLSATEALMRMLEPLAAERELLGTVRSRSGNLASYTAPSNMYRCSDGQHFSLVASSDATFRRLCEAIGRAELAQDARFRTNPARVANSAELDGLLQGWFGARTYPEVAAALDTADLPYSKTYTIDDILADAHFRARRALIRLPDPDFGSLPAPCVVPRVAGREMPAPRSGPDLGEHNDEVYGGLGIDEAQRVVLRQAGVI
ncbi:MAG: CoA transferase [Burkholderiaceae bacterium]|nr:CoA transferase [Burkholderiaceae bacterium]